jgi:hypothetical protein
MAQTLAELLVARMSLEGLAAWARSTPPAGLRVPAGQVHADQVEARRRVTAQIAAARSGRRS